MKLGSKQLRVTKPQNGDLGEVKRNPIYVVLDNVMDTYNVGAVFRLADATAIKELVLCGKTDYPPSTRIHKAAVGTEEWVPWKYEANTVEALKRLKKENSDLKIIAVEQDERAVALKELETLKDTNINPVAIIVGHETDGVSKEVLDLADMIVEIPMWGVNKSLNVVVSLGVALYKILGISYNM